MKKATLVLLATFILAHVAYGSDGFFVTAAAGQSRFKTKYTSRYTDLVRSSVPQADLDERNLYWSVGGGYEFTSLLRVVAGYEDWGVSTGSSSSAAGEIYPLTVGAKGIYAAYAPVLKLAFGFQLEAEVGFLYSDLNIGTDFGSAHALRDVNVRSEYSVRPRYGIGLSYRLPIAFTVGIKYLKLDLPESKLEAGSAFYTDKIRPSTVVITAAYNF